MELETAFEGKAQNALLDDVEFKLGGRRGNLGHEFVQAAHDNLREYGQEYDYDVEPIIESLGTPELTRGADHVTLTVQWDHVFATFAQTGTTAHTIRGNPILSFVWEKRHDPPDWVKEQFEREGDGWRVFLSEVTVDGVPEGRWITDALRFLELLVTGRVRGGVGS